MSVPGITLSTVAHTFVFNYKRYHESAEQMTSLPQWIREGAQTADIKSNAVSFGK